MSQVQGERKDTSFDGRIQLNGDAAPELEVLLELDDQYVVLGHSSGELGRWERATVQVAPIGRGWFTLDVEDEQVTFLPRRPGFFAAATVDLVPVEETKKRRRRKDRDKSAKDAQPAALSRKERKLQRRQEAEEAVAIAPPAFPAEVATPDPIPEPAPPPSPVEVAPPPAPPAMAPAPVSPPTEPQTQPASPWDDLPMPEIPGRKGGDGKRPSRGPVTPPGEKPAKPPREKAPKPPREKKPRQPREKAVKLAGSQPAVRPPKPVRPPKKRGVASRAAAGFWHGLKGMLLRISDELRQTGIVPFDRLPAASSRTRPSEEHEHVFQEHRLPGGLTRNVCHSCGLVSIGDSGEDS